MHEILPEKPSAVVSPAPPWHWPRAAYVHVPFCAHRCGYCDFAVVAGQDDAIDRYIDALSAELATLDRAIPVRTIFIGGGTPTHLQPAQLARLLAAIERWLPLSGSEVEFSVEANPDTLTAEKVGVLADFGVTRVSLGAQSFHPHLLQQLERAHDPRHIAEAVDLVRRSIEQVSLDLIFGVPGQTLAEWSDDLTQALQLEPDHLSTYGLTYETGTPLWKQRRQGRLIPLGEEDELAMYVAALQRLESAGFEHYEVSNFARPGRRCRHNEIYWANEAYFGFGVGAARYVEGRRELNTRDFHAYMSRALRGESCVFQSETLEPLERARETMAVQLRRRSGIQRAAFRIQTGFDLDAITDRIVALVEQGLLDDDGRSVALTRQGVYVADGVIERLL